MEPVPMKIHPNNVLDQMLKNGSAAVISYKSLPRRYMTAENSRSVNTNDKASESTTITDILPPKTVEISEISEEISEEIVAEATKPHPEAFAQTESPETTPEYSVTVAYSPPETAQSVAEPESAPEPEEMYTMTVSVTESESVEAQPDVMQEDVQPDPVPGVDVRILRGETDPGGLVAELCFTGDPSGLVFGASPEYVSVESGIGSALSTHYEASDEDISYPPYINFTCFNRLGLTIKNLNNLLDSDEDFELNILDCNSKDNSWDYIQSLNDRRIKSRIRFDKNCGPIFAVNFGLSRRKPQQFYIVIDSDTYIKTKNWIARFMEIFNVFPEVGLLGLMRDNPYPRYLPPVIPRVRGDVSFLELKNADINTQMDFVPGQLQCLRPGLINEIGYWSEENGFGDAEISPRVVHFTKYKVGFVTTIEIDMTQKITCEECMGKPLCTLSRSICDCFAMSQTYNKNESFVTKNTWKFKQSFQELNDAQRTAYCASIHDPESVKTHLYHADWAYDNLNHYIINAN